MCPEIVLEKREIQLIIDGNLNQVIAEYKEEMQVLDQTIEAIPRESIPETEVHEVDCSQDCCVEPTEDNISTDITVSQPDPISTDDVEPKQG